MELDNRLIEAEDLLISLYSEMCYKHADTRQCKRLDTILSKISILKDIMLEEQRRTRNV